MPRRSTTNVKKDDPIITLKDEVARLALEGARRALRAALPQVESREGETGARSGADEAARERDLVAMAAAYVEIAERARNLDEPF